MTYSEKYVTFRIRPISLGIQPIKINGAIPLVESDSNQVVVWISNYNFI